MRLGYYCLTHSKMPERMSIVAQHVSFDTAPQAACCLQIDILQPKGPSCGSSINGAILRGDALEMPVHYV